MNTDLDPLPTDNQKRIELLDVFRGFAVFGIFVVNIEIMNCVFFNQHEFGQQWTSAIDQLSVRILQLFFYTKFFPIFSFLFGLGISMQALKFQDRKGLPSGFFFRRMAGLFLFGLLHTLLLWNGDVLHLYALIGVFTLLLLKRSNKLILAMAIFLLLFPFYEPMAEYLFNFINFNPELLLEGYTSAEISSLLRSGSYLEGMRFRLLEYVANIPLLLVFFAPIAISMFLFGLYMGKKRLFEQIDSFVDRSKKTMLATAILTNVYRIVFLFVLPGTELYSNPAYRPVFLKLMFLSDVTLGLFYLWLIAWLFRFAGWQKFFSPLKYVGRMALSNYIMHSLIGLIIFSSIGFQRYETLSPSATLLTAGIVFGFQLIFSKIWLKHFYYGPLEWIWRCLSYQKILPLKKEVIPGAKFA